MKLTWIVPFMFAGQLSAQNSLSVTVAVEKEGGTLVLALCPTAEAYGKEKGCRLERAQVNAPTVIEFRDLPGGEYAIKAFQDLNGNGVLDTNWMGFPKEPYGFSNDAMGAMGPPSFAHAKFTLVPGRTAIRFTMKG